MKFYICSLANEGRGRLVPLLTDNIGLLAKFAEDHDQPGRSVYSCPNPLKATATRRCREEVEAIVTLHVDIDFKRLSTPADEVRATMRSLPLPFEIRESGGGLHVLANLKEAYQNGTEHFFRAEQLRSQLTTLLCGDPAPNHSAALLRVVGSHNTKYGPPIEVAVVAAGEPVDITDVEAFLDLYQQPLFELREEYLPTATDNVVPLNAPERPIDYDAVLADMPTTGEGVNAVQYRLLRALVLREGATPDEAVGRVVDATMQMAAREQLTDAEGHAWTHEIERKCAIPRMTWALNRLQKEHWEAVDAGRLSVDTPPSWLWGDEFGKWCDICAEGLRPQIFRNGAGWFVRRPPHSAAKVANGGALELPDPQPVRDRGSVDPEPRKFRFRLISFQEMRPGIEPTYLVDELIPSAGLVLVWGKQKTFKSFWLLDLTLHIAMGWAYRDHAVRQGAVIYCAFEGAHGFKGRVEALRRHYQIADSTAVPLYVMPGQADLIKDSKALVADFKAQLGDAVPAIVVLDTLNRSLVGSESSDEDMTAYTAAAEAIRNAFGCVVVIVHHCGYDETHARGHTSLPAAVDAELSVARDEGSPLVGVSVKHMRDGPEGMIIRSRAQSMPLDPDQNGKPRSSIIIVPDNTMGPPEGTRRGGRNAFPTLLTAMRAALAKHGELFQPDGKLPLRAVGRPSAAPSRRR